MVRGRRGRHGGFLLGHTSMRERERERKREIQDFFY